MSPRDSDDDDAYPDFASQATVERLHSDMKAFRSEQATIHEKINERLIVAEHNDKSVTERLNNGAETFAEIQNQLRPSIGKVAAWVTSFVVALATGVTTVVWQLSKYPTTEKIEHWQGDSLESQRMVENKMRAIEIQQIEQARDVVEIKGSIDRSEQRQQKIDEKIDEVLVNSRSRHPR